MTNTKPITMTKDALQESLYVRIAMTDEGTEAWEQLNAILLRLIGAVDETGELAPAYRDGGLWTLTDDNVLMPSVAAQASAIVLGNDLSPEHIAEVLGTLASIEDDQAKQVHDWLSRLGGTARR